MSSLFVYDFVIKGDKEKAEKETRRIAIIFHSQPGLISESSHYAVRDFLNQAIPADEFLLLVSRSLSDENLIAIAGDPKLQKQIRPHGQNVVRMVTFDAQGQLFWFCPGLEDHAKKLPAPLCKSIRDEGMRTIFDRRDGLLKPSITHHYAKPSGKHCNQFIRAGNVLCNSSEINFIGLCLLPHIKKNITHVYTDTSAINAAAYAANFLRGQFAEPQSSFVIDSFGSYDGLKSFSFHSAATAIVLISASTSGDLVDKIRAKEDQLDSNRIVTLFFLSKGKTDGKWLCDLGQDTLARKGIEQIKSFKDEGECEFCRKGSMCIKIFGEQFLPENPAVSEHLVTAQEVPGELGKFVEQFLGKRIIKCCFDDPMREGGSKREIFLDVKSIFSTFSEFTDLERRWKRNLAQAVPSALTRVVHLDDPASKALAEQVKTRFEVLNPTLAHQLKFQSAEDIRKEQRKTSQEGAEAEAEAVVVVCGCMCTGRKLMSVSQSLREVAPGSAITYLIGISRTPNQTTFKEIKSNLTYGDLPGDYGLSIIQSIRCHDNSPRLKTSWQEEEEVLSALRPYVSQGQAKNWIEKRIAILNNAGSHRGLCTDAFWPKASKEGIGADLELRPGTAFVSFKYSTGQITQAEVFFLVSSTLLALREPDTTASPLNKSPLIQHEHHRVLLAPQCFYRFNDGVIQAAFLRSATRAELAYKMSLKYSELMRDVLSQIFENWDNDRGEACGEFLLALATGRLQLLDNHTQELVESLRKDSSLTEHLHLLSWFVEKTIGLNPKPLSEDAVRKQAARAACDEMRGAI